MVLLVSGCSSSIHTKVLPEYIRNTPLSIKQKYSCRLKIQPFLLERKEITDASNENWDEAFNVLLQDEFESKSLCHVVRGNPDYIVSGVVKYIGQKHKITPLATVMAVLGGVSVLVGGPYTAFAYMNNGTVQNKTIGVSLLVAGASIGTMAALLPKKQRTEIEVYVEVVGNSEKKIVWKRTMKYGKEIMGTSSGGAVQEVELSYRRIIARVIDNINRGLVVQETR